MITAKQKCANSAHRRTKQIKLIDRENGREWVRNRLSDQIYFVMTYHQFLKRTLRKFCKAKKLAIPASRNTKAGIVKIIWENGYDFEDIHQFVDLTNEGETNGTVLTLTERIQIKTPPSLKEFFGYSRALFNRANKLVHDAFHRFVLMKTVQKAGQWIRYYELNRELKDTPEYRALPAQTNQQILRQVDAAWSAFFRAIEEWKQDPSKFRARPRPPKIKGADEDNLLFFTNQQCSIKVDKATGKSFLYLPKILKIEPIQVDMERIGKFQQIRILPRGFFSVVEIIYKKCVDVEVLNHNHKDRILAIDLGVRNIICMVNNCGLRPVVVKGGVV